MDQKPVSTRFLAAGITREHLRHQVTPTGIIGRERETTFLRRQLEGCLEHNSSERTLITGPPGTGKTLTATRAIQEVNRQATERGVPHVYTIYSDLSIANTMARVWGRICRAVVPTTNLPRTGVSPQQYADKVLDVVGDHPAQFILVLDELEKHTEENELFHWFTRFEQPAVKWNLVVISNDAAFTDRLRPELQSSLGQPTHITFHRYTQSDLEEILTSRANALLQGDALASDVIPLIAATETKRAGDARNAIDHLRAAVIAAQEDPAATHVTVQHAAKSNATAGPDYIANYVASLPLHKKLALASLLAIAQKPGHSEWVATQEAYRVYQAHLDNNPWGSPLSVRQFHTILDALGRTERVLDSMIRNLGRSGGVNRLHRLRANVPPTPIINTLANDPLVNGLVRSVPP